MALWLQMLIILIIIAIPFLLLITLLRKGRVDEHQTAYKEHKDEIHKALSTIMKEEYGTILNNMKQELDSNRHIQNHEKEIIGDHNKEKNL